MTEFLQEIANFSRHPHELTPGLLPRLQKASSTEPLRETLTNMNMHDEGDAERNPA